MYPPDIYPWTYTLLDTYPLDTYPLDIHPLGHITPWTLTPGQIPPRTHYPQTYTPRTYASHNLKCLIWLMDHVLITYCTLNTFILQELHLSVM